jgi:hypothetical protein
MWCKATTLKVCKAWNTTKFGKRYDMFKRGKFKSEDVMHGYIYIYVKLKIKNMVGRGKFE